MRITDEIVCDATGSTVTMLCESKGPEAVLDVLCEAVEDLGHLVDEGAVTIFGMTADVDGLDDPMWRNGNDRLTKVCPLADLPDTRRKWLRLGRAIEIVRAHS